MVEHNKLQILTLLVVFICISVIGSASAADVGNNTTSTTGLANSTCPEYGINSNHTGQSDYTGPQTNATKWNQGNITFNGGSVVTGSDGTVYAASTEGNVYALSSNGTVLWTRNIGNSIGNPPAIGKDGTIYVVTNHGILYALSPDGNVKWNCTIINTQDSATYPAIGPDGTIYITSYNAILYAIKDNSDSGTVKWSYNLYGKIGDRVSLAPVIGSGGTIYIAGSRGILYAVNPNGTSKWNCTISEVEQAAPTLGSDGTIYIEGMTALYAVNPDGKIKWEFTQLLNTDGDETFQGNPTIASDGTIYAVTTDADAFTGVLYALSSDGNLKWTYTFETMPANGVSPVIGSDGTIYMGYDNMLYALTLDGKIKWSYNIGRQICTSTVIGFDGTLYVGTGNGLYAFQDLVPNFTYSAGTGKGYLTVSFNGNSTNIPTVWSWDFDDGSSSDEQNPTHTYSKPGTYNVTLTVLDVNGDDTEVSKEIVVSRVDQAPVLSSVGDKSVGAGSGLNFTVVGSDPDGDSLTYSASGLPSGASLNSSTGVFSWTPGYGQVGTYPVTFMVSDGNLTASETVNITVNSTTSSVYVNVTASKSNPQVGDSVMYTFKVGNKGPAIARNVTYNYVIPEGLDFVSASVDQGNYTYDAATRTLTWNIGDVAVGDPSLLLNLRVLSAGTYNLQSNVTVSSYDPNLTSSVGSLTVNAVPATNNNGSTTGSGSTSTTSGTGNGSSITGSSSGGVASVHAATTTTNVVSGSVPMQTTGVPLSGLVSALLLVGSGLALGRRKLKP